MKLTYWVSASVRNEKQNALQRIQFAAGIHKSCADQRKRDAEDVEHDQRCFSCGHAKIHVSVLGAKDKVNISGLCLVATCYTWPD